jgi:hypothetical protein
MEENTHRFSFEIEAEIVAAYRLLENLGPNDSVRRISPKTGKLENWVQPDGLPGIWLEPGFCDRCKPYNNCHGFSKIPDDEWESILLELGENYNLVSLLAICEKKGIKTISCT